MEDGKTEKDGTKIRDSLHRGKAYLFESKKEFLGDSASQSQGKSLRVRVGVGGKKNGAGERD